MSRAIATSLLAVAILWSPELAADTGEQEPEDWKAVAASGQVESTPPQAEAEPWTDVRRGDLVEPESRVRTGRKGRATLVRRANVIRLERESLLSLPTSGDSADDSVTQHAGSVIYQIETQESGRFQVVTPYLTAGVKGTTFMVSVGSRWAAVTVREGIVEVDDRSGKVLEVTAGHTAFVDIDGEDASTLIPHENRKKSNEPQAYGESFPATDLQRLAKGESKKLARAIEHARFQVVAAQALTDEELELFHKHRGALIPSQDELIEDFRRETREVTGPEGVGDERQR